MAILRNYFLVFSGIDKQTGIDYYEVKEGQGNWKRAEFPYVLEDQTLQGIIEVRAVDKAGNERIAEYTPSQYGLPSKHFPFWAAGMALAAAAVIVWSVYKILKRK